METLMEGKEIGSEDDVEEVDSMAAAENHVGYVDCEDEESYQEMEIFRPDVDYKPAVIVPSHRNDGGSEEET